MKKIGYLHLFCRNGRILIANSPELNALLKNKSDNAMVLPFLFDTDDVQIREVDEEEFRNLLPNNIISSPYKMQFDEGKIEEGEYNYHMNSKPFIVRKLEAGAKKLASLIISQIF